MSVPNQVTELVAPIVAAEGLELFDLELAGGTLKVSVDREGGVGLDALAPLTRAISRALDEHDPIAGSYTLEVSSPGLERPLRTPEHFRWAQGKQITLKTVPEVEGERRVAGTLQEVDDHGVVVAVGDPASAELRRLAYEEIERARTVFEWGPAPKPGKAKPATKPAKSSSASSEKRAKAS